MRLLTQNDVSEIFRALTLQQAAHLLEVLEAALASYTAQHRSNDQQQLVHQPQRIAITTCKQATTLVMPVSDTVTTGVKVVTVNPTEPILGAITIYAPNGALQGVLNAAEITAFRTALATMTLLTRWASKSGQAEHNVVIFGAGKQAEWHARLALLLISGVRSITLINRTRGRLEELKRTLLTDLRETHQNIEFEILAQEGNDCYEKALSERLNTASVICCCTPSTEPLFTAADLQQPAAPKSQFLSLIGSYKPNMQEIDTDTVRLASNVWVDSKEACLEESGELIRADLRPDNLREIGELSTVKSGAQMNFDTTHGLTLFKCVGLALMDLAIGKALLDIAEESEKGTALAEF